jgi:predicted deacetylase
MTLFAIRDDDTSAWTDPNHLESIYREFWDRGIPVSLSVIPESVEPFHLGDPERFYQTTERKPVQDNQRLVDYLRPLIRVGKVDIMLHGFDHVYAVGKSQRSPTRPATREWMDQLRADISGAQLVWRGECAWKDAARLSMEIEKGKAHLESVLDCEVRVFVPPSNQITAGGVRAVREARLNLSGLMGRGFDRPFSVGYARAYLRRWMFRLSRGRAFPHTLDLGTHKELLAHSLTPAIDYDTLKRSLEFCRNINAPFVVAVHYWELNDHPDLRERLIRIRDEALDMGYTPATVAECFEKS